MPNSNRKEKMKARGVYFALAMCLVAIAVAGAATYDSVMKTLEGDTAAETSFVPQEEVKELEEVAGPTAAPDEKTEVKEAEELPQEVSEAPETSESPESEEPREPEADESEAEADSASAEYSSESYLFPITSTEIFAPFAAEPVYSPILKDWRSHRGVDIKAEMGDTVRAISSGEVTSAGYDILLGNYVEIRHGDLTATYAGLGDTILVQEGETVTGGLAIGSVYSVPGEDNSTPHLHFELTRKGELIDPMTIFEE